MSSKLNKKILVTGASVITGYLLREMAKKKWVEVYKEEPPSTHPSDEINWKKVLLWSIITGTVISSARLAVERYLTLTINSDSNSNLFSS